MIELKRKYENVIIISTKLKEENIKTVVEKFKSIISQNATLLEVQEWGKRKLAYPINYESEGYYVLFKFESGLNFPGELNRQYKIDDAVVRFMTIATDDKVEKSSTV